MTMEFPTVGRPLVASTTQSWRLEEARKMAPFAPPGNLLALWWLLNVAKYELFRDFYFEADLLGGRAGKGFVADFLVITGQPRPLDIEVQSEAFHESFVHGEPVAIRVYDRQRREILEAHGYAVVWVSETKLDQALDDTMRRALQGIDVL